MTLSAVPSDDTFASPSIDGDLSEWSLVPLLATDAADSAASGAPDWLELRAANDESHLFLSFTSADVFALGPATLVFIDVDGNAATGYSNVDLGVLGSDLMVFGDELYRQETSFNDGFLGVLAAAVTPSGTGAEIAVPLSHVRAVEPAANSLRITFVNDATRDLAPDDGAATYLIAVR